MIIADDVRAICLPNKTFDIAKFDPHITPAEIQHIKPFLGKDFYAAIVTQYKANTLTAVNQTLITNYLKPALAWFTFAKASIFMHVETRNGGFYVNASEFSQGATDKQRADIVTTILQNAEAILDEAKEYIEDNFTDYPLYYASENIDNNVQITGGLILDVETDDE